MLYILKIIQYGGRYIEFKNINNTLFIGGNEIISRFFKPVYYKNLNKKDKEKLFLLKEMIPINDIYKYSTKFYEIILSDIKI